MLTKDNFKNSPWAVAVIAALISAIVSPIAVDIWKWTRDSITTLAYVSFESATREAKRNQHFKTYLLNVVNYDVPNRSPAKLIVSDSRRKIAVVTLNVVLSPDASQSADSTVLLDHRRAPKSQIAADILMPPPRSICAFAITVVSSSKDSDDSTLSIKLLHDRGLYHYRMPKLRWE